MRNLAALFCILVFLIFFVSPIYSDDEQHGPFGIEFSLPINLNPAATDIYQNLHINFKIFINDLLSIDPNFLILIKSKGKYNEFDSIGFGGGLGVYYYIFSKNPLSIYMGPCVNVSFLLPQQPAYLECIGTMLFRIGLHYNFNKNIAIFSCIGFGINAMSFYDQSIGLNKDGLIDQQSYLETMGNLIGIIFYL